MLEDSSMSVPIRSLQRILLDIFPLEIHLIYTLNGVRVVVPLLIRMLPHLIRVLAFTVALLLCLLALTLAFLLCMVDENGLIKLDSFSEIWGWAFVVPTLTNLGYAFIVVEVGVEGEFPVVVDANSHGNFNIKIINEVSIDRSKGGFLNL